MGDPDTGGRHGLGQPCRHRPGVASVAEPQVIGQQGLELHRQEAHLGGELHVALAQELQATDGVGIQHDDGLPEQGAVLRPAIGQHVDARVDGEGPQRHVEGRRRDAHPSAVHVQQHAQAVDVLGERGDLRDGVDGPDLRALRDRHHPRLRPVLHAEAPGLAVDQGRRELAVHVRDGEQLQPRHLLRGAALVHVRVRVFGADDGLPRLAHRLERQDVGGCAVEDGKHLGL